MASTALPKYAVRLVFIWALPVLNMLFSTFLLVPFLLAAALTPVEVPKLRMRFFTPKQRKQLPCLKVPALMRLVVLWNLQGFWCILWRAGSASVPVSPIYGVADGTGALDGAPASLAWSPKTMSVVLPCAGEGDYAVKTVQSVYEQTPQSLLKEIIVVDDGSDPPLSETVLTADVRDKYNVRIVRHEETVGLIGAKKDGGDAAKGDIVVFFDCHVAPQPGWHNSFVSLIGENYRRMVVPVITALDVGTWKQIGGGGEAKCYLTWDADFKWFHSSDPYVPVISGGLLGMSKRWWNETGGYDEQMIGWGGENLDQSLRMWLCGGEIVMAKDSQVAHMWRKHDDPRTKAHYHVKAGAARTNRARAVMAWYGEFTEKLQDFTAFKGVQVGNIDNILEVKERLKCKSFAWFMHRFKEVYEDGGLIPKETFMIKSAVSGHCLTYTGNSGTSGDGKGAAVLKPCDIQNDRQKWHGANRDTTEYGMPCCSGLRAWNTDQCLVGVQDGRVKTRVCEISGGARDQTWALDEEGNLRSHGMVSGFMQGGHCMEHDASNSLSVQACSSGNAGRWKKFGVAQPMETALYHQALLEEKMKSER